MLRLFCQAYLARDIGDLKGKPRWPTVALMIVLRITVFMSALRSTALQTAGQSLEEHTAYILKAELLTRHSFGGGLRPK